jgi:CelD/BcsL family acetyltransferase involved in cellulose biosynthesis
MQVSVLRGAAELAALRPEWEALSAHALEPNPGYEPWMLLPALEAFGAQAELEIVAVRAGGSLAGLFPLQRERRYRGLPLRSLSSWSHPHFMLGVPLVAAGRAAEVLKALLAWASERASVIELAQVAAEGPFSQALLDALNGEGRAFLVTHAYTRPILRRSSDAQAYFAASMPGDVRRELRRREKRLAEAGRLEHVVLRSRAELARWIEQFLALEASGWKGRRGSALACSETNRRFAEQLFTGAFERGRLLMAGLDLDGRPIARYSALTSGEGAIAFKTGFDEALRRFAPGTLALVDLTALAHERPELQWMDSYTAPNNEVMGSVWKDRRTVQRVAVATDLRGEAALALLPALRFARRFAATLRGRKSPARTLPSPQPA